MVKDVWESFKDNFKERVTNPFLGTFTLVWIVHNWRVVYAFFYFDKDWKLQAKIEYFTKYWEDRSFMWNLICVALITLGILIITHLFLAISRWMLNYYENVLIPLIYRWSKGKTYTAEQYNILFEENKKLAEKVEYERKAKNEAIKERDELERRLYQPKEGDNKSDKPGGNLYKNKVVRDESDNLYFIDKNGAYHLLPDEETAKFLEFNEGKSSIIKSELIKNYEKGDEFESVLDKNTKLVWVDKTHIFIIIGGKRFHVPSWDNLYNWKRTNKEEFIDITEDELYTKYPDGK